MYNILICDDDKDIVNALNIYLSNPEYVLFTAYNGQEAVDIIKSETIHLVLMDIMMPVMDGIMAMVKIREISNLPVILLTAKSEDTDKILGLNVGADDYITKPFNPVEVLARVNSQLRRYMQLGSARVENDEVVIGGITLNEKSRRVFVDGEPVMFTPKEFEVLRFLMKNAGQAFTPGEIFKAVWNEEPLSGDKTVAVHIRHIREKIEIDPADPRYLKVIFGQGYIMEKR